METLKKFLTLALIGGLLGIVVVTFVAPSISRMLISAPVSFGVNCEPAADWSVGMLIRSQIIGFAVGGLGGAFLYLSRKFKAKSARSAQPSLNNG